MNTRHYNKRFWAAAALLALGQTAMGQDPPSPAPNYNSNSAAPAVAMTPVPMSEYVQQQPPPPMSPLAGPPVEQAGFAPARLSAPTIDVPIAAAQVQTTPASVRAATSPYRTGPTIPGIGTLAAPTWRWYGWGAATPQGFASSPIATATPTATQTLPPPNLLTPSAPTAPPTNNPTPMPPAPTDIPKVNVPVVPMMEPVSDPNWSPATPVAAPPIAAPAVDMTPVPKPAPAPNTGPAVDPWSGISPPGAKAVVEWRTVRASSAK